MIGPDPFTGRLVRLRAPDADQWSDPFSRWTGDAFYSRLLFSRPAKLVSAKTTRSWVEENQSILGTRMFWFQIQPIGEERVIGDINLFLSPGCHKEASVGIGIGERASWGKGYGTDAMAVIVAYGFRELNLERISLDVYEYNLRAIRSYEKLGFCHEGRQRQVLQREGRRWDVVHMGLLRCEWQAREQNA